MMFSKVACFLALFSTAHAACPCTGNQGYYNGTNPTTNVAYDYGASYGETCDAHDDADTNAEQDDPTKAWEDEPWCYIDCSCTEFPATNTAYLSAAPAGSLCYSYEACGGVDYFTGQAAMCSGCGGYYTGTDETDTTCSVTTPCPALCPCTGNQGYYKGTNPNDNTEYDYGATYGETCDAHDDTDTNAKQTDAAKAWEDETWCYIDCTCAHYPATTTAYLSAAPAGSLCYSYERCGSADYFSVQGAACVACGGFYTVVDGVTACSVTVPCNTNTTAAPAVPTADSSHRMGASGAGSLVALLAMLRLAQK